MDGGGEVFWLRAADTHGERARGSVKGTGMKDKEKVSTSHSVWCSALGPQPGRQGEAHPIRRALCSELTVTEGKSRIKISGLSTACTPGPGCV